MTSISLRTLPLSRVFHIGTLDLNDRERNYTNSYEANCLSVSVTPHAWQQIAKLGGYALHQMTKESALLVDVHAVRESEEFAEIVSWAKTNGLAEDREVFRLWETDEDGEWRFSHFIDEAAAMAEIGELEEDIEGPDGGSPIERVCILGATSELSKLVGREFRFAEAADDYLIMAYAREEMDVDGVWWDDVFDQEGYSAPRGGIFPEKVSEWTAVETSFEMVDDDDELATLEEIKAGFQTAPNFG